MKVDCIPLCSARVHGRCLLPFTLSQEDVVSKPLKSYLNEATLSQLLKRNFAAAVENPARQLSVWALDPPQRLDPELSIAAQVRLISSAC